MPQHLTFTLRPATQADSSKIRALVRAVNINPIGLDWHRFVVASNLVGEIIGCGQVKSHRDGSLELASIAVQPDWRGLGVARTIIEHLLVTHPGELYLTCRAGLEPFYNKFDFFSISEDDMPIYFLWAWRLYVVLKSLGLVGEKLVVMKRDTLTDL